MDTRGWIPIPLIASFNRVRQLTTDVQLVREVLTLSSVVQVCGGMVRMDGWESFVLPGALVSEVEGEGEGRLGVGYQQQIQEEPQQRQREYPPREIAGPVLWQGTHHEDEGPPPPLLEDKNGGSADDGRRRALVNGHFGHPSSFVTASRSSIDRSDASTTNEIQENKKARTIIMYNYSGDHVPTSSPMTNTTSNS